MTSLHVVVLAAGKSTRMKSARPKVLHHLSGRMLIEHVLHSAAALNPETTTLVVGHAADDVRGALKPDARGRAPRGDLAALRALVHDRKP
jgi:bifunctional UDP-N-acetylglucosamine pyrophosphorylase/glucosamine-1-phosphate N-acetyltransferase